MMRLVRMALGLPLVLGPIGMAGQQAQPHAAQKPVQAAVPQSIAQPSHPAKTTQKKSYHAARRRRSSAARAKRAAYRPEYTENSVEVINGNSTQKVVFHNEETATASPKSLAATMKDGPAPIKVEVVNGTATDTQYFYYQGQESVMGPRQPVVVGIQSSDTRVAGGNKNPVVTGITSSGTADAKSASSGGQPVTKSIAPRQKRPDYQPDTH